MLKCKEIPIETLMPSKNTVNSGFSIELKIDGSREIWIDNSLMSARGIDHNTRYNHIWKAIRNSGITCVLDGEVALGEDGNVLALNKKDNWGDAIYYVFDITEYEGTKLAGGGGCSLRERQIFLDKAVKAINSPYVQVIHRFPDLDTAWNYVKQNCLEGLVCKRMVSRYTVVGDMFNEYRTSDWIKTKNWKETKEEIVDFVCGSTKGALVFANGGKVSSLENGVGEIAMKYIHNGKKVFAEIFYMMKTPNGMFFQPKLKRLVDEKGKVYWESGW